MDARPRVSVIIPCFNLGRYLDEAVDSVLGQTFQDFEIIVVDDGSSDPDTVRLLTDYRRPKTRVLTTEHRGLAQARNLAIAHSAGEYLCALDADDTLHPTYLDRAVHVLDEDPGLTFVSCWVQMFGEETHLWTQDRCDLPALLDADTVMTAALVRTAAVREVGGYDPDMGAQGDEDWDLWISLVERGHRGTIIPEALFYYRRRPGSMSTSCTEQDTHLTLVRYLVGKHEESYRRHLFEVLLRKELAAVELQARVRERLDRLATWLGPLRELRTMELERLRGTLAAEQEPRAAVSARLRRLQEDLAHLQGRLDEALAARAGAERRVAELLGSMSWKITAPARMLYDLLRGAKR